MNREPDLFSRFTAAVVIGSLTGSVVDKLFGLKAGVVTGLIASGAHDTCDAPLAAWLWKQGL